MRSSKKIIVLLCVVMTTIAGTVWATISDDNIRGTLDSLNNGATDDKSGAITFDGAGSSLSGAFSSSNAFVRVDTPDTAPAMKLKSKTITIQSYGGDTIIQLGS